MGECVFCKIVRGEIPAEIVYRGDEVVAFKDIKPAAPIHYVFVPKKHIGDLVEASDELILAIFKEIFEQVKQLGLLEKGYRVVTNGGTAKAVPHLHVHLLGEVSVERQV